MEYIGQEKSEQHKFGSDYGRPGKVIVKRGDKIIFWVPGHTSWVGIGCSEYASGSLHGIDLSDRWGEALRAKNNYENGNTLKKSLELNDELIKEYLGISLSIKEMYKPKFTIVI